MGASIVLAGNAVVVINGTVLVNFGDGVAVKLDPAGPIGEMKISKGGNAIYALKNSGLAMKATLRLQRGSPDDQFLNGLLQDWISNSALFVLMTGSFIRPMGDGKGNAVADVYQLGGGIFDTFPGAQYNVDGDTADSVTEYTMHFRNDGRMIQ
jgi:hypothetical protein